MRKAVAALISFAVMLACVAVAHADGGYRYKTAGLIKWRTHVAAVGNGTHFSDEQASYGVDGLGGYVDSASFYVPNAADGADTSAVFPWPADMVLAPAADSLPPIVLRFVNSVAGGSGDTLHAIVEAWHGVSTFIGSSAFPGVTNRVVTGATTVGNLSVFGALPAGAYAGSETAASTNPWTVIVVPTLKASKGFRIRTWGDGTAAMAGNGRVTCEVQYLTAAP